MEKIIIDASVALKWKLDDETFRPQAVSLLKKYEENKVLFLSPSIFLYEIASALIIAARLKRIKDQEVEKIVTFYQDLGFYLIDFSLLYKKSLNIALEYQVSIYDASYVALGFLENCRLITSDQKLVFKTKSLGFVKYLGNY